MCLSLVACGGDKAADGRVKITLFGSGTLASSTDVVDMVEGGGVDIGWVYTGFFGNQYPLTEVTTLVLEGFETCEATTEALWDLYEETPELQEEWGDYKLLTLYTNPANMIMTKDAPVNSLADMKGRSLRSPSGVVVFLVLILLGMNIGLALLLVGFVGYAVVVNPAAAMTVLRTEPFTQGSSYAMIVIPLFIMMGNFAFRAGLSSSLYNAANKWLSRVPGNLAAASVPALARSAAPVLLLRHYGNHCHP